MRKLINLAIGSLFAAILPGAVLAQGLEDENLLLAIPNGYTAAFQTSDDSMEMSEFVPEGETVDDWSHMITVQVIRGNTTFSADSFSRQLAELWTASCAGSEGKAVADGTDNGYPYAVWLYSCPLNSGTGLPETTYSKVIAGADALYSVQFATRRELDQEFVDDAVDFLGKVLVCDSRVEGRACP